jgi:type IX secretion system PorP/SprF family membrane protein
VKACLCLSISFLLSSYIHAQDPQFVQSHSNAIYLNPALTGCFISPVISESYRSQWPNPTSTYKTYSTSYHQFVNALHGGLGFYYMYDNVGERTMETNRINISYAVHFEVTEKLVLRIGATGGYVTRKVDWDKLTFGDLIDPRYGNIYPTVDSRPPSTISFFDCGIGTVAYMKNFYIGASIDHLSQPDESFITDAEGSELPSKFLLNAGGYIPLGNEEGKFSLNPDIMYLSQRDFDKTTLSVTFRIKYLLLGSGISDYQDGIFLIGFENKFLRLSYSYDWTSVAYADLAAYSHELFLSVKLFHVHPKKKSWTPINMEAF